MTTINNMQKQIDALQAQLAEMRKADKATEEPLFFKRSGRIVITITITETGMSPTREDSFAALLQFYRDMWLCEGAEAAVEGKQQWTITHDGSIESYINAHHAWPFNAFFATCELAEAARDKLGGTKHIKGLYRKCVGWDK